MTAPQLQRHVRAAAIALNPDLAEKRRRVERERRGVFLELAPDAMARLIAYLPAADATAAFTAIDALAGNAGWTGTNAPSTSGARTRSRTCSPGSWTGRPPPTGHPLPRRHGRAGRAAGHRRRLDPGRPRRPPRDARVVRSDPRPGRPRARPGRHLAPPAHRRGRTGLLRGHRHLPTRRGPDPHRDRPRRHLHLPRLPTTRHPLRDRPPHPLRPHRAPTSNSPAAAPSAAPGAAPREPPDRISGDVTSRRPARRTCTPCASTTTRPRPTAGGRSPTTPPPGSPCGPTGTGSPTPATPSGSTPTPDALHPPTTTTRPDRPRRPTLLA